MGKAHKEITAKDVQMALIHTKRCLIVSVIQKSKSK